MGLSFVLRFPHSPQWILSLHIQHSWQTWQYCLSWFTKFCGLLLPEFNVFQYQQYQYSGVGIVAPGSPIESSPWNDFCGIHYFACHMVQRQATITHSTGIAISRYLLLTYGRLHVASQHLSWSLAQCLPSKVMQQLGWLAWTNTAGRCEVHWIHLALDLHFVESLGKNKTHKQWRAVFHFQIVILGDTGTISVQVFTTAALTM